MQTDPPSHAAPQGRARVGRRSYQRAAPNGAFNPRCATADPGIQTFLSVPLCSVCTGVRGEPSKKFEKIVDWSV